MFVRISPLQETLYKQLLKSQSVRSCLTYSYNGSQHLVCIGALKKLCNDPQLLYQLAQNKENLDDEKSVSKGFHKPICKWDKVFNNEPSNMCRRQPLKNLK